MSRSPVCWSYHWTSPMPRAQLHTRRPALPNLHDWSGILVLSLLCSWGVTRGALPCHWVCTEETWRLHLDWQSAGDWTVAALLACSVQSTVHCTLTHCTLHLTRLGNNQRYLSIIAFLIFFKLSVNILRFTFLSLSLSLSLSSENLDLIKWTYKDYRCYQGNKFDKGTRTNFW